MQVDPAQEWQRLAEHYRDLSDDELRELAADFPDLTETAQQALRAELHSRRLGDPEAASATPHDANVAPQPYPASPHPAGVAHILHEAVPRHSAIMADAEAFENDDTEQENETSPHSYSWKTILCECEEWKQAWQLGEALRRAGIDSWLQRPREFGLRYARVWVAADQFEQARSIADRPIPSDIVEESKAEPGEYQLPLCPRCGAADPTLEAIEPTNTWHCEQCDAEWSDPADANLGDEEKAGKSTA